jgi:phosphatidylserine/phosphatidylglycerophosphate/cardiolipin synthase-like enzyme
MHKSLYHFFQRLILALIFVTTLAVSFFAANSLYRYQNYTNKAECVLLNEKGQIKRALFSPDDNIEEILVSLIDTEREKISMTAFSLTSISVANALINAKKRNITVELIVDAQNSQSPYSKVSMLHAAGIPVWLYPPLKRHDAIDHRPHNFFPHKGIMHNKFIIFKRSLNDKPLLWTGSYNFTWSANKKNQENVIIVDDFDIIKFYIYQFEIIKTRCSQMHYSQISVSA